MRRIFLLLALLTSALPVTAQTPDSTRTLGARIDALEKQADEAPRVRLSGEFFGAFAYKTTPTGSARHANAFSIDRWFLTAQARLNERVQFRGTTDIRPAVADAKHGHAVVVAYAHADWAIRPDLTLRAGMIPGGWVNHVNKVWGYRGVARILADEEKMLSMGVLGASAIHTLPDRRGEIGLLVHNGQTRQPESDAAKEVAAYAFGTPLKSVPVQVGAHVARGDGLNAEGSTRWGALLAYTTAAARFGVNYEQEAEGETTGHGIGAFTSVRLARTEAGTVSVVGLADLFDPDTDQARDERLRTVVGLAFSPAPGFDLVLDYQRYHGASDRFERYDGGLTDTDASVFFHLILRY